MCSTRLGLNPALAGIKHLNRLEQIMTRGEWQDAAITEGVMLDIDGYVIEGTMSNIFFVRRQALHTPDISRCGVAGITRERVIEQARHSRIPLHTGQFSLDDVKTSDEVFICNSLMGIWPVRQLEERRYSSWPVTQQLMKQLEIADD